MANKNEIHIPLISKHKVNAVDKLHDVIYCERMGKHYPYPFRDKVTSYGVRALDIATEFLEKGFNKSELETSGKILYEGLADLREYEKQPNRIWEIYNKKKNASKVNGNAIEYDINSFLDESYVETLSELAKKTSTHIKEGFKSDDRDYVFDNILSGLSSYHGDPIIPVNKHLQNIQESCFSTVCHIDDIYSKGLQGFYKLDEQGKKEVLKDAGMNAMYKINEKIADNLTSKTIFHPKISDSIGPFLDCAISLAGTLGLIYAFGPMFFSGDRYPKGSLAYLQYANPAAADAQVTDIFLHAWPIIPIAFVSFEAHRGAIAVNNDKKVLGKINDAVNYRFVHG